MRLLLLLLFPFVAHAASTTIAGANAEGVPEAIQTRAGQIGVTLLECEDATLGHCRVSLGGTAKNMTATGAIKQGPGVLIGVFVSTSSSCTIALHDNASAASGTVLLGTTATITAPAYFPLPLEFTNGAYFTEGGTCDVTFYYR